jgi:two-component system, sensor histidine kinase and response regulator
MSASQSPKIDRILVVDDSADNLFLIQTTLAGGAYEVILAEDGKTALAKTEELLPDLILLDVMMPGMDGYEVTSKIRQKYQAKQLPYIPILLITAHQRSSVVKGLDVGADDFLRKPVDIDELMARVRSLLRLKHSIDEREQLSRQQEDFVSRLTHDLRTPLVAVDRMLKLFQHEVFGTISPEMHEVIGTMVRSNKNLLQMVNTLLEVYRYEASSKVLALSPCNLCEMLQEVIQELMPLATEKKLDLTMTQRISLTGSTAEYKSSDSVVLGDRLELRRVLTNLIENAIKFTDQGKITVCVSKRTSGSEKTYTDLGQDWVVVEVQDTGTGIAASDLATVFERFKQANHKRSGSGLGLYLSRRIVESHQGTIEAESELGKGSTFRVYLPVAPQ